MIDWHKYRVDLNIFKRIFLECLEVNDEKVLIVGDYGFKNRLLSPIITNAYALAARELELNYSVFLQDSKERGEYADEVLLETLKKLPRGSIIVLNVSNRIGKLGQLGLSFRKFCNKNNHKFITSSSLGGLTNGSLKNFLKTLNVDYKKMHKKGERIKKALDSGNEINITTKLGTDIAMDIADSRAIINSGLYNYSGAGGNMPAGEVYLPPLIDKTEGVFIIDGSIRLRNKTLKVKTPVKVVVEKGEIVYISSNYEGSLLKETLNWAEKKSKHPEGVRKIAELGIGINSNAEIIGATVIDEKTRGTIHIANGSNKWFGGQILSIVHLDHVIRNAVVKIDGRLLRL
jgi:hypothetical protein